MKVELTVNGGLLNGKLCMSNTQRHEWETAKDSARRVRAWVRRYAAEMGYSAPSEDSAIDTHCKAANGVITISALPITGNGKPQSTRKATASKASRKPGRKASKHAQGVLGRDTEEGGEMAGVWEYAPDYADTAEQVRHERDIRREYAAMVARGAYAAELERKRERDTTLAALIAEQTAAIAAKDTARLADISAKIAAIVAA